MKCEVVSFNKKQSNTIELDESVFGVDIRPDLFARTVKWQLSNRREGNHKVKARSEIVGSTAKPFNQKGGGRARQGDRKAPHMRGGGVAFGPVKRQHSQKLPKKVRKLALKSALSQKTSSGQLVILDEAKVKTGKTASLVKQIERFKWGKVLLIDGKSVDKNFLMASKNIDNFDILTSPGANVYDILKRETLVITKAGLEQLVERLK